MTQFIRDNQRSEVEGRELGFADVARFFKSNWKFVALLTLALSIVFIALALLLPQRYSKQVTLSVRALATELLVDLGQVPAPTPKQVGDLAVGYLQNANLSGLDASPTFSNATQRVEVVLQSRDRDALEGAVPKVVDFLEKEFQKTSTTTLTAALNVQLSQLQNKVEVGRETLEIVDQQIEETPPPETGGTQNVRAIVRLQALETKRADVSADLAANERDLRDLEEARRALTQEADKATVVEVVAESNVSQSRSIVPLVALSLLLALLLAILAALVRTVFGRAK